jgi:[acyl-carrier-protein] S-malonyltransferase
MSRSAMVFPALSPVRTNDLGKFLMISPFARQRVAEADDVLGYHLADALADSEDDYADAVQLAFLVACLTLADHVENTYGVTPDYCAGPSFGERAALAYTGSLSFADTVRVVEMIARIEGEYFAAEHTDVVTHSFVKVPQERLGELLGGLTAAGEWHDVSAYLDHDFFMVSLHERALDDFKAAIKAFGGHSMYTMRPPAHAGIFAPLRDRVARELDDRFTLAPPRIPVVSYQEGLLLDSPEGLRTALLDGFVRPIRWPDTVASLQGLGVQTLYFAGPDSMFHRLRTTAAAFTVEKVDLRSILKRPRR